MKKRLALGLATAMVLTAFTACSSSDKPAAAPAAETETTVETAAETAAETETKAAKTADGTATEEEIAELAEAAKMLGRPTGDFQITIIEESPEEVSEEEAEEISRVSRAYVAPSEPTLLVNNAATFYYEEQLSGDAKELYDAMRMVCDDPVSEDNIVICRVDASPKDDADEFFEAYYSAYMGLLYDHPEFFWLYNDNETTLEARTNYQQTPSGQYEIILNLETPYTNYEAEMTAFNDAADAFLADIDMNADEMTKAVQIHDKLITTAHYDMNVLETNAFSNLAHTAYGALVANTEGVPNNCVCDGYSLAYEYLCQQAGLEATVVPGRAGANEEEAGGHAWSLVKIDGDWYEVDSTWDDQTEFKDQIEAAFTPDELAYQVYMEMADSVDFMNKFNHYLYGLSTPEITNYTVADDLYYVTNDGRYQVCPTGDSVHLRDKDVETDGISAYIAVLLPEATKSLAR